MNLEIELLDKNKKYALLEVYDDNYYKTLEISGYVVAECYLISKKELYLPYYKEYYEVVFTWNLSRRNRIPQFTFENKCYNSNIVDCVFDKLEEAQQYREQKNKELLEHHLASFPCSCWEEEQKRKEVEFKKNVSLERLHLEEAIKNRKILQKSK